MGLNTKEDFLLERLSSAQNLFCRPLAIKADASRVLRQGISRCFLDMHDFCHILLLRLLLCKAGAIVLYGESGQVEIGVL